jgi:hypothetical protein
MIEIGPLRPGDRAAWEVLARGYKAFYRVGAGRSVRADLAAAGGRDRTRPGRPARRAAGRHRALPLPPRVLVRRGLLPAGPVHRRGGARPRRGTGPDTRGWPRAARERGADRFYWHTQESNARARVLYDKVARFTGFIRYAYRL